MFYLLINSKALARKNKDTSSYSYFDITCVKTETTEKLIIVLEKNKNSLGPKHTVY